MALVTITGGLADLAAGGFGVVGTPGGRVEITVRHPSGVTPVYLFTGSAAGDPLILDLSGGNIPTGTTVLPSSDWSPVGSHHEITFIAPASGDAGRNDELRMTLEVLVGPDGGTCKVTDPANWRARPPIVATATGAFTAAPVFSGTALP